MVALSPIWYTFLPLSKTPTMTRAFTAGSAEWLRSRVGNVRLLDARGMTRMID
jgi:hypothetical protein